MTELIFCIGINIEKRLVIKIRRKFGLCVYLFLKNGLVNYGLGTDF